MIEKFHFEKTPEYIPQPEEIQKLFERFTQNRSFENIRIRMDEKGLYLWDIKLVDSDGDLIEYTYMRKGKYPEGEARNTAIHVTYLNKDGEPVGGHSVAKYINQKWVETP